MSDRNVARLAGALFVAATVPFSISVAVLEPLLESADFLALVGSNPGRVSAGVLLELTNHAAVVGIAVVLYPVLRRGSEILAVAYVAARAVEATLFAAATTNLLELRVLSGTAGTSSAGETEVLSALLRAGHDWNQVTLPFVAFALGALILNYHLFRHRIVPRWISGWGFLAGTSILAARLLILGGMPLAPATVTLMDAPIFAQEMVFAGWLILRGVGEGAEPQEDVTGGTL